MDIIFDSICIFRNNAGLVDQEIDLVLAERAALTTSLTDVSFHTIKWLNKVFLKPGHEDVFLLSGQVS